MQSGESTSKRLAEMLAFFIYFTLDFLCILYGYFSKKTEYIPFEYSNFNR
jgi:hypothetical protein